MPDTRSFHLGDILTVATGRLVSPNHMDAVYNVCNFMTGDDLMTHQLPRVCEECAPEILRQHPDLAAVGLPDVFDGEPHVYRWLAEQVARFGEYRTLAPLAEANHTRIDPLVELRMMRPDVPVIVVEVPDA